MTFPALANDGSVVNLLTGAELQGLLQTIGNNAIAPATQPVSGTVSIAGTVPVSGSFYPATQPVSIAAPVSVTGTVAVTGVATSALQTTGNGYLQSIVTAVQDTTPAAVTQSGTWSFGLTGTLPAFAATPTFNLGTLNGAATEVTLAALNTKTATLGRKVSTGSAPVVLASDHANVPTAPDGVSDAVLTAGWDGTALPTTGYGAAIITVSAIAGGASIAVFGTLTGTTDHAVAIINLATNTIVSAITTVGIYQVTAAGSLKYVKTGGTATVNVLLKR